MICDCRTDVVREAEAVEFLFRRRVDGLILIPSGKSGKHLEALFAGRKTDCTDRSESGEYFRYSVLVDNRGAAEDAVKRLLLAGHRRIGMIAGPEHVFTARERYLGYEAALKTGGDQTRGVFGVYMAIIRSQAVPERCSGW